MLKYLASGSAKGTIIFAPALGVKSSRYVGVAEFFNNSGYHCYLVKARIETESAPPRKWTFSYDNLIHEDFLPAVEAARIDHPGVPVIAAGHSLGGQIAMLYSSRYPEAISALLLIATGSPYWRAFPLKQKLQIRCLTALVPLTNALLGYFPGDVLGFGDKEASGVMRDWNQLAKHNRFHLHAGAGEAIAYDYEAALKNFAKPTLCFALQGDTMAPITAVQCFADKLCKKSCESVIAEHPQGKRYTHFSWTRSPAQSLARAISWLDRSFG